MGEKAKGGKEAADRASRLAAELRANLKKRKARLRASQAAKPAGRDTKKPE